MTSFFRVHLLIAFFSSSCFYLLPAQGIDQAMDILGTQAEKYQELADLISLLPDHLEASPNELDSKGDELKELVIDLTYCLKAASSSYGELQNEMDTFESIVYNMLEETCPDMEKAFEKFAMDIEPAVEMGEEPALTLDGIDNRYDEKFLLKSFAEAEEEAWDVEATLMEMREDLMELYADCK